MHTPTCILICFVYACRHIFFFFVIACYVDAFMYYKVSFFLYLYKKKKKKKNQLKPKLMLNINEAEFLIIKIGHRLKIHIEDILKIDCNLAARMGQCYCWAKLSHHVPNRSLSRILRFIFSKNNEIINPGSLLMRYRWQFPIVFIRGTFISSPTISFWPSSQRLYGEFYCRLMIKITVCHGKNVCCNFYWLLRCCSVNNCLSNNCCICAA